jgi:hypothetical protein
VPTTLLLSVRSSLSLQPYEGFFTSSTLARPCWRVNLAAGGTKARAGRFGVLEMSESRKGDRGWAERVDPCAREESKGR